MSSQTAAALWRSPRLRLGMTCGGCCLDTKPSQPGHVRPWATARVAPTRLLSLKLYSGVAAPFPRGEGGPPERMRRIEGRKRNGDIQSLGRSTYKGRKRNISAHIPLLRLAKSRLRRLLACMRLRALSHQKRFRRAVFGDSYKLWCDCHGDRAQRGNACGTIIGFVTLRFATAPGGSERRCRTSTYTF